MVEEQCYCSTKRCVIKASPRLELPETQVDLYREEEGEVFNMGWCTPR